MDVILDVALPLFALIAIGYVIVRARLVPDGTVAGLNGFVFFVAIPALLFDKVRETPFAALVDLRLLTAYYAPTLILFTAVFFGSQWLFRTERRFALIQALAGTWANTGYMGIPLLLTLGGPALALPAVLIVAFDNLILAPIAILVLEAARGDGVGLGRTLRSVLRNLSTHPLILAVFAGTAASIVGLVPPTPAQTVIDLLAGAAIPCALFALGGSLVGVPVSAAVGEVATLSLVKMLAHPALVAVFVYLVLPLDPVTAMGTVIAAALPTATMVFVMAQRYETYVVRSSTVVLVTHVVAVATVSGLLIAFGNRP
ncbi:MAG: AEC family transporter [Pseudomonadota bacterium]